MKRGYWGTLVVSGLALALAAFWIRGLELVLHSIIVLPMERMLITVRPLPLPFLRFWPAPFSSFLTPTCLFACPLPCDVASPLTAGSPSDPRERPANQLAGEGRRGKGARARESWRLQGEAGGGGGLRRRGGGSRWRC